MIDADRLDELLTWLRLTAIRDQLDSLLDEAGRAADDATRSLTVSGRA